MGAKTAHARLGSDYGFTLIEVVVTIFMAVFLITTTFFIVDNSNRSYRAQERVAAAQQDVRAGLDLMVREIRMAGYNPMGLSGAGVVAAEPASFGFSMDINCNNALDTGRDEQITYSWDDAGRRVMRSYPTAAGVHSDVLIENVTAFNFDYVYYEDEEVIAAGALDQIGMVVVTITCQDRDAKGGTFERTLSSSVKLRNFKL